jgi:hypothetical protein
MLREYASRPERRLPPARALAARPAALESQAMAFRGFRMAHRPTVRHQRILRAVRGPFVDNHPPARKRHRWPSLSVDRSCRRYTHRPSGFPAPIERPQQAPPVLSCYPLRATRPGRQHPRISHAGPDQPSNRRHSLRARPPKAWLPHPIRETSPPQPTPLATAPRHPARQPIQMPIPAPAPRARDPLPQIRNRPRKAPLGVITCHQRSLSRCSIIPPHNALRREKARTFRHPASQPSVALTIEAPPAATA